MSKTIIAAFANRVDAEEAVDELEANGYTPKDISVITKDHKTTGEDMGEAVADGAVSGAATGSAIGGLAGLLAGAGVLPALAGLLIGGPIAAALGATGVVATTISGAVTGAVAGGFIGALTNLGLSEEEARSYSEAIESGGYIIAVPEKLEGASEAAGILRDHGATHVRTITA